MTKPMTSAQRSAMFARKNAAKKAAAAPAPAAVKAASKPATVLMTVESLEERVGPKAGPYAYAKISFPTKAGQTKSGRTAVAFGEAYAALKNVLQPGATVKVLAHFNRSVNLVGLAA